MPSLEEELLHDEQELKQELAFLRTQLPLDLKDAYTDEQLSWMLDTIVAYYYESGVLDTNDDEVDIDLEQVAQFVCQKAAEEGLPKLSPDDVRFVVEADLDFQEQTL